jgi:hypothetical protein
MTVRSVGELTGRFLRQAERKAANVGQRTEPAGYFSYHFAENHLQKRWLDMPTLIMVAGN